MLQTIPLNQLEPSPRNVRKTGGNTIADIEASIAALGLLQNLGVTKPKGDGPFLVTSGQRRLAAMRSLVGKGKLPADFPVPCRVVGEDSAGESSLAENVVRQAMHPADEFDAFKVLADAGKTSDEIAERFGCEPKHVEQRLRLANIAPDILADYRAGNANLEQMHALALTDDAKVQRAVWQASAKSRWEREPERLRSAITKQEVDGDNVVAQYVGVKAYEAAGGKVRKDLFGDDVFFPDALLLERLALTKLQKTVDKVQKEGWKWGEARLHFGWQDEQKFGRVPHAGKKDQFTEAARASAGFIVSINHNGQGEVARGLVRPQDRTEAATAAGGADKIKGGSKAKAPTQPGDFSFAAIQRLQAEASAELQVSIADDFDLALRLLVAEMAHTHLRSGGDGDRRRWVFINREHSGRVHGPHKQFAEASDAGKAMEEAATRWRKEIPTTLTKVREWALTEPIEKIQNLLAFLVARETECIDSVPGQASGVTALAAACEVNLADHWKPTVEWLATLSKSTIVEMVRESGAKNAKANADKLAKLSKADLPKAAFAALPDRWLPGPLSPPKARAKLDGKQKAAGEGRDDG